MLPQAFCEKMRTLLGAEYEAFLSALDRPRAVGLRLNPRKLPAADFGPEPDRQAPGSRVISTLNSQFSILNSPPVPWEPTGYTYDPQTRPGLHPWHEAGVYYLQEPSAMAPVALLDPQPGERVLDLCAAPGGKTTQIAGRMGGRGLLVCNEIHPKRAFILSANVERLGVPNALVLNEHPARLAERFSGWFDRILVDAPCSGEGMFRKHDAAFTDWSPDTVAMCARRQDEILNSAAGMLRPGGRMVYSTCTFSPEEDEGSVQRFLAAHPDFSLERIDAPWFSPGRPDWVPKGRDDLALTFRLWPHRLRGEGHFAAVLRKGAVGPAEEPALQSPGTLPRPVGALIRELELSLPEGIPVCFGENCYLAPQGLPRLEGLRVLRPGLELAQVRKERAIPAHALALWSQTAPSTLDLLPEDPEVLQYLRGATLACDRSGWTLVRVGGFSLGWGKASAGVLKNHYPKGLRRS